MLRENMGSGKKPSVITYTFEALFKYLSSSFNLIE